MRLGRWMVALGAVLALGFTGSVASAAIHVPKSIVAASFRLGPARSGSGEACDGTNGGGEELAYEVRGTETDLSSSPHPELDGHLTVRVRIALPNGHPRPYPVRVALQMTLRDSSGATKYTGSAVLAGQVNGSRLSATGLLTATLYAKGKPTNRSLLAAIALRSAQLYGSAPLNGSFGVGTPHSVAIETAAVC